MMNPLPWARPLRWLTGAPGRCLARLPRDAGQRPGGYGYWGRCELDTTHVHATDPSVRDHALERGMMTIRWAPWAPDQHYVEGPR